MRKANFLTRRWRLPSRLRREDFAQLFARTAFKSVLDAKFIEAVEKRRDLVESRQYKMLGIQGPILAFLALSMLHIDVDVSLFGLSVKAAKSLQEVFLVLSTSLGLFSIAFTLHSKFLSDLMRGYVAQVSKGDASAAEVLELRFGISLYVAPIKKYGDLRPGAWQYTFMTLWIVGFVALVCAMLVMLFGVHIAVMREIYLHPNFSSSVSAAVIAYVLLGDAVGLFGWLLFSPIQPFTTYEDLEKLDRLKRRDNAKYRRVINEMAKKQIQRGFIRRILFRPQLPRID